jgi:hypothetical protein
MIPNEDVPAPKVMSVERQGSSSRLLAYADKAVASQYFGQHPGIRVGTAYRAQQELSKNLEVESLSRIPDSAVAAAD